MHYNQFGFPTKKSDISWKDGVSVSGGMNFWHISNNNYAPAASEEWT
jgi:hypothetical protein